MFGMRYFHVFHIGILLLPWVLTGKWTFCLGVLSYFHHQWNINLNLILKVKHRTTFVNKLQKENISYAEYVSLCIACVLFFDLHVVQLQLLLFS